MIASTRRRTASLLCLGVLVLIALAPRDTAAQVLYGSVVGDVKDATGRTVMVPDRVERVMAAGPTAAVVLYVLAPEKMIAWPSAPRPNEREFILPAVRDLPEFGRLTGRHRGRD